MRPLCNGQDQTPISSEQAFWRPHVGLRLRPKLKPARGQTVQRPPSIGELHQSSRHLDSARAPMRPITFGWCCQLALVFGSPVSGRGLRRISVPPEVAEHQVPTSPCAPFKIIPAWSGSLGPMLITRSPSGCGSTRLMGPSISLSQRGMSDSLHAAVCLCPHNFCT